MERSISSLANMGGIILAALIALATAAPSQAASFPSSGSPDFCVAVQQAISSTGMVGSNTLFADMPSYRHSKPSINPLNIYQVVTYAGAIPMVVSCKMKTAAHLRDEYGADAAGEQKFCHHIATALRDQAVEELRAAGNDEAAARAAAFVIDQDEPFITGRDYLADFRSIYRSQDGNIHIASPGLFQDYDRWYTMFLPDIVKGQSYCHLAAVEYVKAIADGSLAPDTVVTTADDAPTQPN